MNLITAFNSRFRPERILNKIPSYSRIMLPLLKLLGDRQEHSFSDELVNRLTQEFDLPVEVLAMFPLPSGEALFFNRASWAKSYLERARLIETTRMSLKITPRGVRVLGENLSEISSKYLLRFSEFKAYYKNHKPERNTYGIDRELYLLWVRKSTYKIGMAVNAQDRANQLSHTLVASTPVRLVNPHYYEVTLHNRFRDGRQGKSEFFHLSNDEVKEIVKTLRRPVKLLR